jgi:hypothetical protein
MVYSFLKRCLKGRKGTQSHINTLFSNLFNADLLRNLFPVLENNPYDLCRGRTKMAYQ